MNLFAHCQTPSEAKARYRELATILHPDAGGADWAFQQLQKEYEQALRELGKANYQAHVDAANEALRKKAPFSRSPVHFITPSELDGLKMSASDRLLAQSLCGKSPWAMTQADYEKFSSWLQRVRSQQDLSKCPKTKQVRAIDPESKGKSTQLAISTTVWEEMEDY